MGLYLGENKMSKRFGRNQKRAMRKQMELMQIDFNNRMLNATIQHNELSKLQNEKIKKLTHTVDLTAEILGNHFIALPPETMEVRELQDHYNFHVRPHHNTWDYKDSTNLTNYVEKGLIQLETFTADLKIDELQHMVHMHYSSAKSHVAYAVSDLVFKRMPTHRLEDALLKEVALSLSRKIASERSKYENNFPGEKNRLNWFL